MKKNCIQNNSFSERPKIFCQTNAAIFFNGPRKIPKVQCQIGLEADKNKSFRNFFLLEIFEEIIYLAISIVLIGHLDFLSCFHHYALQHYYAGSGKVIFKGLFGRLMMEFAD